MKNMNKEKTALIKMAIETCFLGVCYMGLLHAPSDISKPAVISLVNLLFATILVNLEELIIIKMENRFDGAEKFVVFLIGWWTYSGFYFLTDFLSDQQSRPPLYLISSLSCIALHMLGSYLLECIGTRIKAEDDLFPEEYGFSGNNGNNDGDDSSTKCLFQNNYWVTIREELKHMLFCHNKGCNGMMSPILIYLEDMIRKSKVPELGITRNEVIKCIDHVMEYGLYPIELHESEWAEYQAQIKAILITEREFLELEAPEGYQTGVRRKNDEQHTANWVGYYQRNQIYFATVSAFYEDWPTFEQCLLTITDATEKNIQWLLRAEENACQLIEEDSCGRNWMQHVPGRDAYQPLFWLTTEVITCKQQAAKWFSEALKNYGNFLKQISNEANINQELALKLAEVTEDLRNKVCDAKDDTLEKINDKETYIADRNTYNTLPRICKKDGI